MPSGSTRRIFLVGYYGVGNLGDEAIRTAVERAAEAFGAEVTHYATRGPTTGDPREVRSSLRAWWQYLEAIRSVDRVVLGGGGILKDEGLRLPLDLLATALAARLLGRPVGLLGVGVGPFYSRLGRFLVRAVASLADIRTVRDEELKSALRALGVVRVEVGADPVLAMAAGPDLDILPAPAVSRRGAAPVDQPRRVLVSVRPPSRRSSDRDERRAACRKELARGLRLLVDRGFELEFAALYWPRDRDEAAAVTAFLGPDAKVTIPSRPVDWPALVAAARRADMVVAMRYHCVAAAAAAGRPVVALVYEPKVAALASELRLGQVDINDPDLGDRLADGLRGWLDPAPDGELEASPASADPAALEALQRRGLHMLERVLTG